MNMICLGVCGVFLCCFCEACQVSHLIEKNVSQNFSKQQDLEQLGQTLNTRKEELERTTSSDATLREYSRVVALLELVERIKLFDKSQDGTENNNNKEQLLKLSSSYEEDIEDAIYNHVNKIHTDDEEIDNEEW